MSTTPHKWKTLNDVIADIAPAPTRFNRPRDLAGAAFVKLHADLPRLQELLVSQFKGKTPLFRPYYAEPAKITHGYWFGNARMPLGLSPRELVWDSLSNVLGRAGKQTGSEIAFITGDKVIAPDNFVLIADGLHGQVVYTGDEHALHGYLAHFSVVIDGKTWMFRIGAGSYPIPVIRGIVEKRNPPLGTELWITTDHMRELSFLETKYGSASKADELFAAFHGEEALAVVRPLMEAIKQGTPAQSFFAALAKGEGFNAVRQRIVFESLGTITRTAQKNYMGLKAFIGGPAKKPLILPHEPGIIVPHEPGIKLPHEPGIKLPHEPGIKLPHELDIKPPHEELLTKRSQLGATKHNKD